LSCSAKRRAECERKQNDKKLPKVTTFFIKAHIEVMLGRMEGTNRKERPHREWLDDIAEWGKALLQELRQAAMNRKNWKSLVKMASDTYGR